MTEDLLKRMENIEEFVNMPKGAIEPPVGTVVGSVSGPLTARPDKEDLDLDELLRKLQAYIDDAIAQALGNYISDLPADVYELLEEYITNNITFEGGGTDIRRAFVKTTPVSGTTVACYLDSDNSDMEVSVNCNICGGSDLSSVLAHLVDGDDLMVAKVGGDWYALGSPFQDMDICS